MYNDVKEEYDHLSQLFREIRISARKLGIMSVMDNLDDGELFAEIEDTTMSLLFDLYKFGIMNKEVMVTFGE